MMDSLHAAEVLQTRSWAMEALAPAHFNHIFFASVTCWPYGTIFDCANMPCSGCSQCLWTWHNLAYLDVLLLQTVGKSQEMHTCAHCADGF